MQTQPESTTLEQLKAIVRRDLKIPADVPLDDAMSLTGGQMDFDSLDVLLVLTSVEKAFGIAIEPGQHHHESLGSLAQFATWIDQQKAHVHSRPSHRTQAADATPAMAANHPRKRPERLPEKFPGELPGAGELPGGLPHGASFRFVTRFTSILPGRSGMGQWQLTGEEPFFAGHFPGQPIVPGVLISESMAQVSGLALHHGSKAADAGQPMALVHVDVRFVQPVVPPAVIVISTSLESQGQGLSLFEVAARVQGVVVAQGRITLGRLAQAAVSIDKADS